MADFETVTIETDLLICGGGVGFDPSVVARRVIEATNGPIQIPNSSQSDGGDVHITTSVGVVAVNDASRTPTAIIGNAESAVAKAVEGGRARYVLFDEELQQAALIRHETEQALHNAIVAGELDTRCGKPSPSASGSCR